MGKGMSKINPQVSTQTQTGEGSTATNEDIQDSINNHFVINVTGGVVVLVILLLVIFGMFALWKLQVLHHNLFHHRYHNLARHTGYREHEETERNKTTIHDVMEEGEETSEC